MTAEPQRMSVDAYLAFERTQEHKHELVDGMVRAMAGASTAHNLITGNIFAALHLHLRDRDCTVFSSDMRLALIEQHIYVYPDVMVICGDMQMAESADDTVLNPTIIIEVLSPSTEIYDRGKKSHYYRVIPSLQEYVLIAQDAPYVEQFVRYSDHQWLFSEVTDPTAQLVLPSINATLSLSEIYRRVVFPTE